MIKLTDILKEIEGVGEASVKQQVLNYLEKRRGGTLPGTAENRLVKKLIKDTTVADESELQNYFRALFTDRKNTMKLRLIAVDILDRIEGKKPW